MSQSRVELMWMFPKRLATRLVLSLTLMVATIVGGFAYVGARSQESALLAELVASADQISRGITAATRRAMQADHRQDAYAIMKAIGDAHGIKSIRIFNKEGVVTFSTDPKAPRRVDKNAEACFPCHARKTPLIRVETPSRARVYRGLDGHRKLAMSTPVYNTSRCANAACHAHPAERKVLGVLDVALDVSGVDRQITSIRNNALWLALITTLTAGLVIMLSTRLLVTRPIRRLIRWTHAVADMQLDHAIDLGAANEMKELATAFNLMQSRLKVARDDVARSTHALEDRVHERTQQLEAAQKRLIQSDRMVSLGQLAASVAHEINNPLAGVLNFSMLMERILTAEGIPPGRIEDFRTYLHAISQETTRVGQIVSDLLAFSRRSSLLRTDADLNCIVTQTAALLSHKISLASVSLEQELAPNLPRVPCDASQVQQVVINLLMNATEATAPGGVVVVKTDRAADDTHVLLTVSDTGTGIAKEHLGHIFEPFYSSKDEGKGVGLGLSVVYGIVQAHGGVIDVTSEPEEGTIFRVQFPLTIAKSDGEDT